MELSWLNVFQLCKFLKVLGHVMVFAVLSLVGISYYSVVVVALGGGLVSGKALIVILDVILMVLFHSLIFMLLWSYLAAVVTDPGTVPPEWHPFADDETEKRERQRFLTFGGGMYDKTNPHRPRFCRKCAHWKPERAHHCSVSRRCIMKMDHYCIWVVNCVGLLNYKFFLLFLVYTWVACILAASILAPTIVEYFHGGMESWSSIVFLSFVIDVAFVIGLLGFLGMHLKLLSENCTSIELHEKQEIQPWPYDKGWKANVEEVFGSSRWQWLLPFHSQQEKQSLMDSLLSPRLVERAASVEDV